GALCAQPATRTAKDDRTTSDAGFTYSKTPLGAGRSGGDRNPAASPGSTRRLSVRGRAPSAPARTRWRESRRVRSCSAPAPAHGFSEGTLGSHGHACLYNNTDHHGGVGTWGGLVFICKINSVQHYFVRSRRLLMNPIRIC